MSKEYKLIPYKSLGDLVFGMSRDEVQQLLGKPISSIKYGFPIQERILEDYGFFYTLFSKQDILEAVQFFPQYTKEEIVWSYCDLSIQLTDSREAMLSGLNSFTDDLLIDEDEDVAECYYSKKLGLKFFFPYDEDEDVVSLIVHDLHCYDEEEQYLKDLENGVE